MRCPAIRFGLLVMAWLVAAPACLPVGEPPAGQPLWAGREGILMAVLPARSPDDGVTRVVTLRGGPIRAEMSLISAAPSGVIADQSLNEEGTCHPVLGCIDVDHRGRVFAWSVPADQRMDVVWSPLLSRIDLDSGERIEFGMVATYEFSPSRRRIVLSPGSVVGAGDTVVVLEADDGGPTELSAARYPKFVGEDLYFVGADRALQRLPAGGPAEVVRAGVEYFSMFSTSGGPRLVLRLSSTGMSRPGPLVLLNPATGEERTLPPDGHGKPIVSPDGQWALIHDADLTSRRKFSLFDITGGIEEPFEIPADVGEPEWRPNHSEVWFQTTRWPDRSTFVKEPHQPLRELPAAIEPLAAQEDVLSNFSFFSRDGSRLFSIKRDPNPQVFVGDADDPAGPRFPLNPPGTRFVRCRELADGRLVVEAFYRGPDRNDIYLVDPKDGATRLLGKDGITVARGSSRVLSLTHRVDQLGDLEVMDLDTGHATALAREFAVFAFAQPRLDDPDGAPAGAPVVFQFRARFASPYDGFWLTTLP